MRRKDENFREPGRSFGAGFDSRQLILVFTGLISVGLLAIVLQYSRYGIDFTDEGFYLFSIAEPFAYHFTVPVSLFGFVYHPLYLALSDDIGALRIATNLGTYALAFLLAFQLLDLYWREPGTATSHLLAAAAGISSTSLLIAYRWLLTPSYNTLAQQGLMLAMAGLLALEYKNRPGNIAGTLLIGFGGWLTFMAKAGTAGALGLLVIAYGLLAGRRYWRPLLAAALVALGLLIVSAFLIDGSIPAFAERLSLGLVAQTALGSGQGLRSILSLYRVGLSIVDSLIIAVFVVAGGLAGMGLVSSRRFANKAASLLCGIVIIAIIWLGWNGRYLWHANGTVLFFGITGAVAAFALPQGLRPLLSLTRQEKLIFLLLLGCPFLYALGTNNNYWAQAWPVGIFWILAGVVLARPLTAGPRGYLALLPMILLVQFFTLNALYCAFQDPYRQPPDLRKNNAVFSLRGRSELMLDASYRSYLVELIRTAEIGGFREGMPAIDLTGQSPGPLFAMGARSLGQPWLVGDYRGSDELAITSLRQADCRDIARAWLLEEPGGPRSLTVNSVLRASGAERGADYEKVATFLTPEQAGGYVERRRQNLLRPTRSVPKAEIACLRAREKQVAAEIPREKP